MSVELSAITPILIADDIAPCLVFWEKLGFALAAAVPDAPPYRFVMLAKDKLNLMVQTRASVMESTSGIGETVQSSLLYLDVAALDPVLEAVGNAPVEVARHKTFYGTEEIYLRDPAGNVIGFAAHV